GVLAALSRGPAIVVGLAGGGFVDRTRRRPVLVGADLGRAVALATIPLAAVTHRLGMVQLYVVAAVVGALSVLFDIADHAYLPTLIRRDQLVDGNSKLAITDSVAEIGGPGLYGVLFQLLTAPIAIAVNAATYLFSALALAAIRKPEPAPAPDAAEGPVHPLADFAAGLRAALGHPALRPLLVMATVADLFGGFFSALYTLYAIRVLGLSAPMLGTTVAVGGVAALGGAAMAGPVIRRLGLGPAFALGGLAAAVGTLFIPLGRGAPVVGMAFLIASQIAGDSFGTVADVAGRSLRQTLAPPALLGRVGGVFAALPGATGVTGAVLGGVLGGVLGVRPALWIACAGLISAALIPLFSPLARLKDAPASAEA
ncbi:MAG TPA: MFS transporter, partial [Caulobacteraceae bacterium]|nr:MFS transporter [Caulobacteraceae bacterium]